MYQNWQLFEKLPEGWKVDKSAGTPLCGYEFCITGSPLKAGYKRALVKVEKVPTENKHVNSIDFKTVEPKDEKPKQAIDENYLKTVNILARKKFEEKLLNDIRVDLMVCEIEGWSKTEYLNELKRLIDSMMPKKKSVKEDALQLSIFSK